MFQEVTPYSISDSSNEKETNSSQEKESKEEEQQEDPQRQEPCRGRLLSPVSIVIDCWLIPTDSVQETQSITGENRQDNA